MDRLKILYVGPDYRGSNGTCWRDAFVTLGHDVRTCNDEGADPAPASLAQRVLRKFAPSPSPRSIAAVSRLAAAEMERFRPDLTFFVKLRYVTTELLEKAAQYGPRLSYMNDDMFNPDNQTASFHDNIRAVDWILTTKSYNVREFLGAGAANATYIPNAYDPAIHYPVEPSPVEREVLGGDVGFIGTFRRDRADFLARLKAGAMDVRLNVWGGGWDKMSRADNWDRAWAWRCLRPCVHRAELFCEAMGKAIQSSRLMLGLLFRKNRDLHTSRSFEIPACGGFMLAERTEEHRLYFEEDKEAVYFDGLDELADKIRFYVAHDDIRTRIAAAGYRRCLSSPYTYVDRARTALEIYARLRPRTWAPWSLPATAKATRR